MQEKKEDFRSETFDKKKKIGSGIQNTNVGDINKSKGTLLIMREKTEYNYR